MKLSIISLFVITLSALAPLMVTAQLPGQQRPKPRKQLRGNAAAARGLAEQKDLGDGTLCVETSPCDGCQQNIGANWQIFSSCESCKNTATYWYTKAWKACGEEPKWDDGTICALGTTCNACKNTATFWDTKFITACGDEPCWKKRTICAAGTTCNNCCSGHSWKLDQFITSCD
jgi:hypothetical protein